MLQDCEPSPPSIHTSPRHNQRVIRASSNLSCDSCSEQSLSVETVSFLSENDVTTVGTLESDYEAPCSIQEIYYEAPCLVVGSHDLHIKRVSSFFLGVVMSSVLLFICVRQLGGVSSSSPAEKRGIIGGVSSSSAAEQRGIIQAPEFDELLKHQSRILLAQEVHESGNMKAHLDGTKDEAEIDSAVQKVHTFLADHVDEEDEHRLRNVKLSEEDWRDLGMLCQAIHDKRVQHVGKILLQEIRQNLLAEPGEIGEKVSLRLGKNTLLSLSEEVLTQHLREALVKRGWDRAQGVERKVEKAQRMIGSVEAKSAKVWQAMLDPFGERFNKLRNNASHIIISDSDKDGGSMSLAVGQAERRLRDGPWKGNFKLEPWEKGVGITSLVFISAAEILAHVDLLVPDMNIPLWVEVMLFTPAYALGTVDCIIGLSFWCDFFLGALGLNALDAIAVLSGLDLVIDSLGPKKLKTLPTIGPSINDDTFR